MKTRLTEHDIDKAGIDNILKALEKHGMTALSETQDVNLDISREILETAL